MLYIGTSGYSYDDWVGPFYPAGLPKNKFLEYYARYFNCVEVNYTYYRMPDARTLDAMGKKTRANFQFAVKAPGVLTHERNTDPELFRQFKDALAPLRDSGKLACVLAQFPSSFHPGPQARDFIAGFAQHMGDFTTIIEFRNAGWVSPETFEFLRLHNLGYCCVDEPRLNTLMPPVAEVTCDVGYVRFHGRNAAKWFRHKEAWERYDYLYSAEELGEWTEKIKSLTRQTKATYVFFNNHFVSQAVQNALVLAEILAELAAEEPVKEVTEEYRLWDDPNEWG